MKQESSIINILTYKLPFKLASQIYNEYQNRLQEAKLLIGTYKTYKSLQNDLKTIELFLSLSIFHRRVITNLDGAVKFYGTVTKNGETDTVRIGNYNLNGDEKNKILAVVLNYNALLEKFSIPQTVMEYYETRELLKNIIALKSVLENAEYEKRKSKRKGNQSDEEEFPF